MQEGDSKRISQESGGSPVHGEWSPFTRTTERTPLKTDEEIFVASKESLLTPTLRRPRTLSVPHGPRPRTWVRVAPTALDETSTVKGT